MICLKCRTPSVVESEKPGERRYQRCECGEIGIVDKAELERKVVVRKRGKG